MIKIYRAMHTSWLSQGFKQNLNPIYKQWNLLGHNGYDWPARSGTKIHWDVNVRGVVKGVEMDSNGGIGVDILTHTEEGDLLHRFWHLLPNVPVKAGDIVQSGDLIGYCDTTGVATGSHLHRGLKRVAKDEFGNWQTVDKDNGYFGGIPIPDEWFVDKFIVDEVKELNKKVVLLSQLAELLTKLIGLRKKYHNIYE